MRPASIRRPASGRSFLIIAALLPLAIAARAEEDPLLGRIKGIQCVGCTAGSVDLIIHDPIDVRDFQVRINESDYQKIISPLPGKTVYDKNGCFYWFEAPKGSPAGKADSAKAAGKSAKGAARKAPVADSAAGDAGAPVPPPSPEIQGTPSRCIPYSRVEPAPSNSGKKKD